MNHTQIDPEALKRISEQLDEDWREYRRDQPRGAMWAAVILAVVALLLTFVVTVPVLELTR